MENVDLLDQLLAVADSISDSEDNKDTAPKFKKNTLSKDNEDELFLATIDDFSQNLKPSTSKSKNQQSFSEIVVKNKQTTIHNGDTDSSDDESNRDYQNSKYNDCGKDVKHLLSANTSSSSFDRHASTWKSKRPTPSSNPKQQKLPFKKEEVTNVYTDPFFGIRISNPLISSVVLQERMSDRAAVSMAKVKQFITRENNPQDWVIAGVIVSKSPVKTSQKGTQFLIWTLSDLKNDLQTVSVFLFGNAYKLLWKTTAGTVLGILNPSIMENRDGSKDQAALSVDNAQKVMVFGQSKDYGICKSKKKDGNQCNSFVNKNSSEYCVYHIKQEYQKLSKRSELQANFVGGGLTALRNKVLGKNEVFYAGKSFSAVPAKKSQKLMKRDNDLLKSLSQMNQSGIKTSNVVVAPKIKPASSLEVTRAQRMKDLQMLKKLNGGKVENIQEKIDNAVDIDRAIAQADNMLKNINRLGKKLEISDDGSKTEKCLTDSLKSLPSTSRDHINTGMDPQLTEQAFKEVKKDESLQEFDFLNAVPSTSRDNIKSKNDKSPQLNNSKITDEILKDLDKIESHNGLKATPKRINGSRDMISTPSTSKNTKKLNKTPIPTENTIKTPKNKSTNTPKTNLKDSTNLQKINEIKTPSTKSLSKENTIKNSQMKSKLLEKTDLTSKEYDDLVNKSKFFNKISTPKLSNFGDTKIDLSSPIIKTSVMHIDKAKLNALKYVEKHGPIKKEIEIQKKKGVKRFLESSEDFSEKRAKLADDSYTSERFKKMMAIQSKHTNLLAAEDLEREEKYFKKLEIKEKMEEKMATIFKVECKAVRCLTCKYESFSAADRCKEERHVIKVIDAVKRFFKCAKCGNRTVSLQIIPLSSCTNCGGSKWDRTTMMREKTVQIGEKLSIRGMEEKYVGHVNTGGNINLLMPDE